MRQTAGVLWIESSAFGTCTAASLSCPHLAMIVGVSLTALAVAVVLTALYAPKKFSERAFRLLPWICMAPIAGDQATARAGSHRAPRCQARQKHEPPDED
jgi:hypothetical protein